MIQRDLDALGTRNLVSDYTDVLPGSIVPAMRRLEQEFLDTATIIYQMKESAYNQSVSSQFTKEQFIIEKRTHAKTILEEIIFLVFTRDYLRRAYCTHAPLCRA